MKKRLIVLSCAILVLSVLLGACSGGNDIIYKENGKVYYQPNENESAKQLVTDDQGETVLDENGNMIWVFEDTEGKEQTAPVTLPALMLDGNNVSCQQFTMKIPRGWESIGKTTIMIKDPDKGHQIDYSYSTNEDGSERTVGETIEQFRQLYNVYIENKSLEFKTEAVTIGGMDASKVIVSGAIEEDPVYLSIYLIQHGKGVMSFVCGGKADDVATFDYLSILNSIEYR